MEKRVRFIRKKNNYFLLIVIILFAFILNNKIVNAKTVELKACDNKDDADVLSEKDIKSITTDKCLIKFNGDKVNIDNINKINKIATKINSINLQKALDDVSENGGGTVTMPSGRFYFSYLGRPYHFTGENHITGEKSDDREDKDNYEVNAHQRYAIRVRNNVTLTGSIDEGGYPATILAIYHEKIIDENDHGIDMFYYNNIRDTGYATKKYGKELHVKWKGYNLDDVTNNKLSWFGRSESISMNNVTFKNFIIDGDYNAAYSYESSGNGFRTSFYQNCVWDNVIVMNTNATGFGCDYPKNSIIKNSKAINCGKEAKEYYIDKDGTVWDGGIERAPGGSGFGIGTGYSDEESLIITDCEAFNNAKFGFFFEQQSRFGNKKFNSIKGKFVVKDSIAGGNMFDYGGLYSTGAIYDNVKSVSGNKSYTSSTGITAKDKITINLEANNQPEKHESHPLRFGMFSANNYIINKSDLSSALKDNLPNNNKYKEVHDSIIWAVNRGVLDVDINTQEEYDAGKYGTYFRPTSDVTRFDAIVALYKFNNMPMKLQPESGHDHYNRKNKKGVVNENSLQTYFDNISVVDAANLYGNQQLSGSQLSLTKYKKAGDLDALKWAYDNGITMKGSTTFDFDGNCTREMIVSFLYRMAGSPKVDNYDDIDYFTDVPANKYYYNAVKWAVAKGIAKGTSSTKFSPDGKVDKQTLAVFLKRYYDNIIHTVKFVLNGEEIAEQNVKHGDQISQVNPKKTGYTLNGWYSDKKLTIKDDFTLNFTINGNSENYSFSTPVTSNKTLYAKWTETKYKITYTMNEGTNNSGNPNEYTITDAITLRDPSKIFTVKIDENSQSATISSTSVKKDQKFKGWTGSNGTTAETSVTIAKGSTGNKKYTANWTPVDLKLPTITKTGYTCGYAESKSDEIKYASEANYTPDAKTNSATLYAKCTANKYTITYTMNGGTNDNPSSYTIASNAITLKAPIKTFTVKIDENSQSATISSTSVNNKQTFKGWTGSNGTTAEASVTIAKGSTGNKAYTANWTPVDLKLPTITKTGYTCGFATTSTGDIAYESGASYKPNAKTNSATLYAKCNANTHVNNTVDYEGIYDGKDHTISINVELYNYVIKYSVGNTNYDLTELPKFKDVGEYTINYKISSNGYDDLIGSNKVKIYGIKKIDSSIKIKDNKLIIRDNSFNSISNKITVYSISNEFKHYNKNNELVSNDTLKTSDVIKIVLNGTSSQEYRVVFLGDNSGDGQINSADLLKVRKHLLNSSILTDIYYMASDVDSDGDIDSADLLRVRQHLLGKIKI